MPRRGYVCVRLSSQECAAAAEWLRNSYTPPKPNPMMDEAFEEECRENRAYLIKTFEKCARRKAADNARRELTREAAVWFGERLYSKAFRTTRAAPAVQAAMNACYEAGLMRGRGRRRIDRTADEVSALALGSVLDGNGARHRRFSRAR